MRVLLAVLLAALASSAAGQSPVPRVVEDARVLDRIAEVSRGDLPQDVLRRLVEQDIDLLRGKRTDGTYQYAAYERLEGSRTADSFSIQPSAEDKLTKVEIKATFVYRAILEVPSRRLIVARNKPVYVDHVEIESMPQTASTLKTQVVKVEAWLQPGTVRPIDLDDIGRQATVRVFARTDKKSGYGNLTVTLLQAKVVDLPDSPYADAVASEKAILRGIDHRDNDSIRAMAQRIESSLSRLAPAPAAAVVDVVAPRPAEAAARPAETPVAAAAPEVQSELQAIEDLLTGTESEKRQGMDRLHQLIRRMRGR